LWYRRPLVGRNSRKSWMRVRGREQSGGTSTHYPLACLDYAATLNSVIVTWDL
jgi:hypothetical protein